MDYHFQQAAQAAMDARAVELGYISPNQFDEDHEELACGFGRALGVNEEGALPDVLVNAQRIADKYGIIIAVDVRQVDEQSGLDFGHRTETVEPSKQ